MQVRLVPAARRDLREIWQFSRKRWGQATADRYLRDLQSYFTKLANSSALGRDVGSSSLNYLRADCRSHAIIFRRTSEGHVIVSRVLHVQQDILRHI